MKPEYIASRAKKEREEVLSFLENCVDEIFTVSNISGELFKCEIADGEGDMRSKRDIVASVIRNLHDLCEEEKIGQSFTLGRDWYGTNQAIAKLRKEIEHNRL